MPFECNIIFCQQWKIVSLTYSVWVYPRFDWQIVFMRRINHNFKWIIYQFCSLIAKHIFTCRKIIWFIKCIGARSYLNGYTVKAFICKFFKGFWYFFFKSFFIIVFCEPLKFVISNKYTFYICILRGIIMHIIAFWGNCAPCQTKNKNHW